MMRRVFSVVLIGLLALIMIRPVRASADVLWEPYDSKFYDKNMGKMTVENRGYCVNSPEGYEYTYESPDNVKMAKGYRANGTTVYCSWSIEYDGHRWGLITYDDYEWMVLDNCYKTYNGNSFLDEYSGQIVEFDEMQPMELKKGYFYWQYPGAEGPGDLFDCPEAYPIHKFVDEDGNEWYHFGYTYGLRNFWVNMTDPTNKECKVRDVKPNVDTIYPAATPDMKKIVNTSSDNNWSAAVEEDYAEPIGAKESNKMIFAVGGVLMAAVIGAAAAIVVKIRKK